MLLIFLNYWNTSLQNKLQTDKIKPILLISEGHLQNGPTWLEQKVSSGQYEGVLSAQFKGVDGLVQQALQGQEYHCQRDSTVCVSSKRSRFSLLILPRALVSFMSVTALSTGVSGIIAVHMYRRKELLPASGCQGQTQHIFHVALGGYERNRMSLKPSNFNLHLSWQRASQQVLHYWAFRTGMKNKSWSFVTRWRNGGGSEWVVSHCCCFFRKVTAAILRLFAVKGGT